MSEVIYQGKKVYYEEHGEGPLVIFAHGNTASGHMFDPFLEEFQDYHCVVIDFLGHGRSERLDIFPVDFWYDQGMQLLALLEQFPQEKAILIGCSGGAIAVLNVALEQPERIRCVIADSFEGENPLPGIMHGLADERKQSLEDADSIAFYQWLQGADYAQVVKQDTDMMLRHAKELKVFYHHPLSSIQVPVLLTGSEQDDMIPGIKEAYEALCQKSTNFQMHTFPEGNHPVLFSNGEACIKQIKKFIQQVITKA